MFEWKQTTSPIAVFIEFHQAGNGKRVLANVADIQTIEEGDDGVVNVTMKHSGQYTHDFRVKESYSEVFRMMNKVLNGAGDENADESPLGDIKPTEV